MTTTRLPGGQRSRWVTGCRLQCYFPEGRVFSRRSARRRRVPESIAAAWSSRAADTTWRSSSGIPSDFEDFKLMPHELYVWRPRPQWLKHIPEIPVPLQWSLLYPKHWKGSASKMSPGGGVLRHIPPFFSFFFDFHTGMWSLVTLTGPLGDFAHLEGSQWSPSEGSFH